MSATNSTPTINLPLFIGTDKPAWLTDWNGSMNTIDGAIATLQTAESGTATALASLSQSVTALSGTVEQHTTAIQTVTTATATNTGSINTITSLIGNGEPTTTDKTIIGAINEIYADIGAGDGVDADEVNYDNTSSGLTATDVQAAIDEVNAKIPQGGSVDADDVSYDNTQSGLTASNVQAAIDELADAGYTTEALSVDVTKGSSNVLVKTFTTAPKYVAVFLETPGGIGIKIELDVENHVGNRVMGDFTGYANNAQYAESVTCTYTDSDLTLKCSYGGGTDGAAKYTASKIMYK